MINKKVLVLGRGFLGSVFERYGYEVLGRDEFDWSPTMNAPIQPDEGLLRKFQEYSVVINCIAKSDTRWCENPNNFGELFSVNALLPKYISELCERSATKFVQISTGCLYDSRGAGKSKEDDFLSAHCNYVVSKWTAEGYLRDCDLIIRPRLIFDSSKAEGRNNLLQKLPTFCNYLNEFNSVTSCDTIVESIEALLDHDQSGIFNVANRGTYTMYEMAMALGHNGGQISQEDLHESQGLFLVNNVMATDALEKFYKPRDTIEELIRCSKILNATSCV